MNRRRQESKTPVLNGLWYVFDRKRKARFAGLVLVMFSCAVLDAFTTYLTLPFVYAITDVDTFLAGRSTQALYRFFGFTSAGELIMVMALCIAAFYLLRNLYITAAGWIKYRFLANCRSHVSSRLFYCVAHEPYSHFLHTDTANILRLCTGDVDRMFSVIESFFVLLPEGATLLFLMGLLLWIDPVLTLLTVVLLSGLIVLVNRPIARLVAKFGKISTKENTAKLKWIHQFTGGLKGLLATRRQQLHVSRFAQHADRFAKNESNNRFIAQLPAYLTNAITMGAVFLYVAVLARQGHDLAEKIPTFALFAAAALRLLPSFGVIVGNYNNIRFNQDGLQLVFDQFRSRGVNGDARIDYRRAPRPIPSTEPLQDAIVVEHVTFRFANAETPLFQDASLSIPANRSVAFVGTTGSGKTTMADIILGLQTPDSGRVVVDGRDIAKEPDWWADRIGYIPQYIYLSDDTIRANVAFGVAPEEIDDDRVRACLADAQLLDFVDSLPGELDAITGENGVRLSGGQRQRIGIARALYADPPFIVMDEATSSLDDGTEAAVIESVHALAGKKTLLIIAHRLTTIRNCDIIYRIEKGTVNVERDGTVEQ